MHQKTVGVLDILVDALTESSAIEGVQLVDAENAQDFREPNCREVAVKFLGVWDTVGALGIPLDIFKSANQGRYEFHDTTISSIIDNAYHALAIDERRKPFQPTIWKTKKERQRTEQCWFAGAHSDIGGGYHEAGLSHIALRWMAERAEACGLALDQDYLDSVYRNNNEICVHNSFRGAMRLLGSHRRPIGVTNLDETLHNSAEQRFLNNSDYRPKNLREYLDGDEQIRLPL